MSKNKVLLALAPVALMTAAGLAQALPYVNDIDRASLLIYTDIDVRDGRTTLVQITNDVQNTVHLQCYWLDASKRKTRFDFTLTGNQTIVVDAKTGNGSAKNFPSFPTSSGYKKGELVCFAVQKESQADEGDLLYPISWNFLIGKATVLEYGSGDGWAYEQAAWGIQAVPARGLPLGGNIQQGLELNNAEYRACARTVLGEFIPLNRTFDNDTTVAGPEITVTQNKAVIVSCEQDLRRNNAQPVYTKLDFDIYDEQEDSLGYYQCADSWTEIYLGSDAAADPFWGPRSEDEIKNFTNAELRASAAYYRVTAADRETAWQSCDCAGLDCPEGYSGQWHYQPGLIGSQASWMNLVPANDLVAGGSNLHNQTRSYNSTILVELYQAGKQ